MPNFVMKANERQDVIAYILSLKKTISTHAAGPYRLNLPPIGLVRGSAAPLIKKMVFLNR